MILFVFIGGSVLGWMVREFGKTADRAMEGAAGDPKPMPVDPAAVKRVERIAALQAKGDAEAVSSLEAMSQDPDRTVRSLVEAALAELRARKNT
jgi:hypothetical protein